MMPVINADIDIVFVLVRLKVWSKCSHDSLLSPLVSQPHQFADPYIQKQPFEVLCKLRLKLNVSGC